MRRASEANIPDSARLSTILASKEERPLPDLVASSPTRQLSPLSGSLSDEETHTDGLGFDFSYKHPESQSTVSLASDIRDHTTSSLSGSTMSPTAPFTFSPDPNVGSFQMDQGLQLRPSLADFHHREKRSNTFPSLNIDYLNQPSTSESTAPRLPPASTAPSSALDSPAHELQAPFSLEPSITSPPTLRRSSSNSSMNRSTATPVTGSAISSTPVDSSPVSPSQEDARRAAATLLTYIQNTNTGAFDPSEYMAVVALTKKLQLHQHSAGRPSIGGLSRIPEGDTEMPPIQLKMEST